MGKYYLGTGNQQINFQVVDSTGVINDLNLKDGIMFKAAKNKPLSELHKLGNKRISTVRYKVEQPYGLIKKRNGERAKFIGMLKVSFSNIMNCIIHNVVRSFKFVTFA